MSVVCGATLFLACNDDPAPEHRTEPSETLENAYEYNGVKNGIRSVIQARIDGSECVFLSPAKNIFDADELLHGDSQYVLFVFKEGIDMKETDLASVDAKVDLYYYTNGGRIFFKAEGENRPIASGTILGKEIDSETAVFDFSLTTTSGTIFRGNFAACVSIDYSAPKNRLFFDQHTLEIKSAFAKTLAPSIKVFTMTPEEGITTFDRITENNYDYFQLSVTPPLLNKKFDIMHETEMFTIFCKLGDTELNIGNNAIKGVKSGTCYFDNEGSRTKVSVNLVLDDGRKLFAEGSCVPEPEPEPDHYMAVYDHKVPVATVFYKIFQDAIQWSFLPNRIDFFWETIWTDYQFDFKCSRSLADGKEYDMKEIDEDRLWNGDNFTFIYVDRKSGDGILSISPEKGQDETNGTFRVKWDSRSENAAAVEFHFVRDNGEKFDLNFDGICIPADDGNQSDEYLYDSHTFPISSVIVDISDAEIYDIWLCSTGGITDLEEMRKYNPVIVSVPVVFCNGMEHTFSDHTGYSIVVGTNSYGHETGFSGRVKASLAENDLILDFKVGDRLKGHYAGPVLYNL